MQHLRSQQCDPALMMLLVVPGEEALTEDPCILDGAEALGEFGPVLESFELALGVRVVVGDVGAATRWCLLVESP